MSLREVLLVEDNEDDIELMRRAFQDQELCQNLVVARDGEEALHYLSTTAELPALILLDLKLPKIDGLEVLKKIRAHAVARYIPVVVMSTSSQPSDVEASYSNGANSYIRKPVDFDQFMQLTQRLGHYWLGINESLMEATL